MRILMALAFTAAAGCTGDLVELGSSGSGSKTGGNDMAMAGGGGGDMAGGGGASNLTFKDIQGDLDAKICSSSACHGSADGTANGGFMLIGNASSAADLMTNYTSVSNEINLQTPAMSLLLTNPAGMATPPHTGGMLFTSGTSDPTYQRWLGWITNGAPEQ